MREQGPGSSPWRKGEPEAHGLSSETLNRAADALALTGERQGLVVIRNGVLVYERYWRNDYHLASPEWRNVSFSSGKSWGSTMVGLAYTKGLLGLDDLAAVYHRPEISGLRPETTIRHLLTMTSGGTLNVKPSSRPPRRLDDARSPGPGVEYAWEKVGEKGSPSGYGVSLPAGQTFYYDGAAADHLADIVAAAAGVSSHRFMMEQIISPLGCEQFNYQPEGVDRNDNVR
ncbi:MAG: class C beta-lactamase-related serine hydrolase, partial [Caulobacteraceae bacterium]